MLPKISDYEINFDCETISSEFLKVSQRLTPEKSINNFNIGENEYRVQETISNLFSSSRLMNDSLYRLYNTYIITY